MKNCKEKCNHFTLLPNLPLDKDSYCIFHTKDLLFRSSNNFHPFIKQYIDLCAKKDIDIVFKKVTFNDNEKPNLPIISDLSFKNKVRFINCQSTNHFQILNFKFEGGLSFQDCNFEKGFLLKNGEVKGLDFKEIICGGHFSIRNINKIKSYFNLDKSKLNDGISIENTILECYTILDSTEISIKNPAGLSLFKNVTFDGTTVFESLIFNSQIIFQDPIIKKDTEINNCKFNYPTIYSDFSKSPITFENIIIEKNGKLALNGSASNKVLFADTTFTFKEIMGQVNFNNINFEYLKKSSKNEILKLQKLNKIQIQNCEKYKNKTPIIRIELKDNLQKFGIELSNIFVTYFNSKDSYNLGVEIVEQTKSFIELFYFSDDEILEEEFFRRIDHLENKMWNLIGTDNNKSSILDTNVSDWETQVSLASLFFKLNPRLKNGTLNQIEFNLILNSIYGNSNLLDTNSFLQNHKPNVLNQVFIDNRKYINENTIHKIEKLDSKEIIDSLKKELSLVVKSSQENIKLIEKIIIQLFESERKEILEAISLVNENLLSNDFVEKLAQELNSYVFKIHSQSPEIEEIKSLLEQVMILPDQKSKFKFMLPIIPGVLKYEHEFSWNLNKIYKNIIRDLKNGDVFFKDYEEYTKEDET